MSRRNITLALAALLVAIMVGWWAVRQRPGAGPVEATAPGTGTGGAARPELALYFPGAGGRLYPEARAIDLPAGAAGQVRELVGELIAGPRTAGLVAPLPPGVEVASVFLDDGVVYLDLASVPGAPPLPWGTDAELAAVYSIVDTVLLNVPTTRSVVLLWNGRQQPSFAGHVDTSRPLAAETDLLAR